MDELEEYVYQPQMNNFMDNRIPLSKEQVFQRLTKGKNYKELEEQKRRMEEEEFSKYTFRPNVSKKRSATSVSNGKVVDRLFQESESKYLKREIQKREEEEKLKEELFQPTINKKTLQFLDLANYKPVYERVGQLQKQKNEKIVNLKIRQEIENPDFSFKPQLNEVSVKIAECKFQDRPFTDRLGQQIKEYVDKKYVHAKTEPEETKDLTFQPQLNPNSVKIAQESNLFTQADFLKRQEMYKMREKEKQQMKSPRQGDFTFSPQISQTSKLLIAAKTNRGGETLEEKMERLAYKEKKKMEHLKDCLQEKYYSQFNYQPEINAISKSIAKATDLTELVNNSQVKRKQEEIAHQYEEMKQRVYTFKPQTNETSKIIGANKFSLNTKQVDQLAERVEEKKREKEKKIDQAKRMYQYEELKDCTFQPQTNKKATQKEDAVVVRGLGKHLERTEKAKKLKDEQLEREDKAFKVKLKPTNQSVNYTIPEPFNFHYKN